MSRSARSRCGLYAGLDRDPRLRRAGRTPELEGDPQPGCRRQARNERDRAAEAEGVGDTAGDEAAGDVARVAPEAVDADDGGARARAPPVGDRGDPGRGG